MTDLETRVTEATLKAGGIRGGALAAGVGYATAREAMSSALAEVGARQLPSLLHSLSLLAFGFFQTGEEAPAILVDRWGLKPRQAQIIGRLATLSKPCEPREFFLSGKYRSSFDARAVSIRRASFFASNPSCQLAQLLDKQRLEAADFFAVRRRKCRQDIIRLRRQPQQGAPPIKVRRFAPDETQRLQPVDEFGCGMRLHDQTPRYMANRRVVGFCGANRQQRLVLLRLESGFRRLGLAEHLKLPQREPELRERGIIIVVQIRRHEILG